VCGLSHVCGSGRRRWPPRARRYGYHTHCTSILMLPHNVCGMVWYACMHLYGFCFTTPNYNYCDLRCKHTGTVS
jgi:hypothetical protein